MRYKNIIRLIIFLSMFSSFIFISAEGEEEYQVHLKTDSVKEMNKASVVRGPVNF